MLKQLNETNLFTALALLLVVTVPAAPAADFGLSVSAEFSSAPHAIRYPVAIATAIGYVVFGALSGHMTIRYFLYYSDKRRWLALLSALALVAYAGVGLYKLSGTAQIMVVLEIGAYLLFGLQLQLKRNEHESEADAQAASEALALEVAALRDEVATVSAENTRLISERDEIENAVRRLSQEKKTLSEETVSVSKAYNDLDDAYQALSEKNKALLQRDNWQASAPPILLSIAKDYAKHDRLNGSVDKFGISATDVKHIDRIARKSA